MTPKNTKETRGIETSKDIRTIEVDLTPRETTLFKVNSGIEGDLLSNPKYPRAENEIYSSEEAEAVRNGKLSVEVVVDSKESTIAPMFTIDKVVEVGESKDETATKANLKPESSEDTKTNTKK